MKVCLYKGRKLALTVVYLKAGEVGNAKVTSYTLIHFTLYT
jgi:hypothetical protein